MLLLLMLDLVDVAVPDATSIGVGALGIVVVEILAPTSF